MNNATFLLSAAALAIGTYAFRYLGVRLGSRMSRRQTAPDTPNPVRLWFDRAATVLIGAVCVTSAVYVGQDFAGGSRVAGVAAGVVAAVCRLPMLGCVIIGMAVCAGCRLAGLS